MTQHQTVLKDLITLSGLSNKQYATKHEIEHTKLLGWVNGTRNIQFCTLELLAFEYGKKLTIKIEEL